MRRFVSKTGSILVILAVLLAGPTGGTAQSASESTLLKSPKDGGPRRWDVVQTLELRSAASHDADVIARFETGTILHNKGCTDPDGQVWCQVSVLVGNTKGFAPLADLKPAIGPDGKSPFGPDQSRNRARKRDFDATARVACAQERGQTLGTCTAGVSRSDGGDATMAVTFPNGFVRSLYFVHGQFVRASATMSGVGTDIDWQLDAGVYELRVDDQRFEFPVDLIISR